jgi:hypothetical protein
MEIFFLGVVCGIGLAVAGMVIWNLQSPAGVDKAEDVVRKELTDDWERAKTKVKDRARRVKR